LFSSKFVIGLAYATYAVIAFLVATGTSLLVLTVSGGCRWAAAIAAGIVVSFFYYLLMVQIHESDQAQADFLRRLKSLEKEDE